jgi:TolA-binding protein
VWRGRSSLALAALVALVAPAAAQPEPADDAADTEDEPEPGPSGPIAQYFGQLERMGLVDIESGDKDTLKVELEAAERLLRDGDAIDAAVALYAIVETPRYEAFTDFVEYQNAEYDLGVALANAGAYGAALDAFERVLRRGPDAPYWGPAHRRTVDVALETRDHGGVLARLEHVPSKLPIPPSASGERAYLRGRAAYDAGKLDDAEQELATISKKSRLYSSALYLRGVIATRQNKLRDAAEAFCEIADTPDSDTFTFVVDDRYFTVKDLARLGLARIAHEQEEYDDAYYHYFQIPEDSTRLPDALFEASWSMYQKRELGTARDLVKEFLANFPSSPMWPEGNLLAGYIELADCRFDEAQAWYDGVVERLDPVVKELDRIRKDPDARSVLFDRALIRWRGERETGEGVQTERPTDVTEQALGLLRLDPGYVRLHDAISGMRRAAGEAPGLVKLWSGLARRVRADRVGKVTGEQSLEAEDAASAHDVAGDLDHLAEQVARARRELARARRTGTIDRDDAKEEEQRLTELAKKVDDARGRAHRAADEADEAAAEDSEASIRPLITADLLAARRLDKRARALLAQLEERADALAQKTIDDLYKGTKRVADKAKLGKIDAVIGQKQALDIQVQDFAQGRFPPELHGRLWDAGLIGDDEEVWPFEGEYWADEYEGWR